MNSKTALGWVKALAEFAKLAPAVVEAFTEEHPELREGPLPDAQDSNEQAFLADLEADQ